MGKFGRKKNVLKQQEKVSGCVYYLTSHHLGGQGCAVES